MADEQRTIQALIKFGVDPASLQGVQTGTQQVNKALSDQVEQLHQVRQAFREVGQIGTVVALAGAAIYAPAMLAVKDYLATASKTDQVSEKWIDDQDKIKNSYTEVGRVIAAGMLPALDEAVRLAGEFATWAQANPQLLEAIVAGGGFLVVAGGALKIGAELGRAVVDIQLIAAKLMGTAADKQTAAAAAMDKAADTQAGAAGEEAAGSGAGGIGGLLATLGPGLAILAGVGAGVGGYDAIAKATGRQSAGQIAGEAGIEVNYLLRQLVEGGKMDKFSQAMVSFTEKVTGLPQTGGAAAAGAGSTFNGPAVTQQQMDQATTEFENNEKQKLAAEKNYNDQVTQIEQTADDTRIKDEQTYQDTVTQDQANFTQTEERDQQDETDKQLKSAISFAEQETQATQDYYTQRAQEAQAEDLKIQRAEEDHQEEMATLLATHDQKVKDLAASRDALGIVREQQSYELEREQKEDTYQKTMSRDQQDYAIKIADEESKFRTERERKMAQFVQTMSDEDDQYQLQKERRQQDFDEQQQLKADQHKIEMKTLDDNEKDQLDKLQKSYQDQVDTLQTDLIDRINAINPVIIGDYAAYQAHLVDMSNQFQTWINSAEASAAASSYNPASTVAVTGKAAGGYATNAGLYAMAEQGEEFVLNAQMTKYAESIVQGRLTQSRILAAMMTGRSGGAGGGGSSVTDNRRLSFSNMTSSDRAAIREEMANIAQNEIVRAANG